MLKHLICLAGAGGTGKTSVLDAMVELLGEKATRHDSIVRSFYASRGVVDEADFLSRSDTFRKNFQLELYQEYYAKLEDAYNRCSTKYLLCDRSIFDHYAYTLYGCRGVLTQCDLDLLDTVRNTFVHIPELTIGYLPYPTPWDKEASDGFRARVLDKDLIVDALIYKQIYALNLIDAHRIPFDTPKARAAFVIRRTNPLWA